VALSDPETPELVEDETIPPIQEFLTNEFLDMMHFVERFHATRGKPPSDDDLMRRFNVAQPLIEEFKIDPLVQKSLRARGINYPHAEDILNDRQLAAIAVMTNYVDKRSDEKKLRDIGISTREFATWMLDDDFSRYLQERAERMFIGAQHEAHMGLIKGMRNGNVASVKLFNEMSGRFNPDQEHQFNIRLLMSGIIEILQKHVRDPITLHKIANEMMNLAARESPNELGRGVPGRFAPPTQTIVVPQKEIEGLEVT